MNQGDCIDVSIGFRVLDDDGLNSISMIDEPKLFFKFDIQQCQELWTGPWMTTLAAVEESTLQRRFETKYFVIFSHERMVSCVQDMISSIEIIRPNCHEYLREQIADRACDEAKYLSITNPKNLMITVDIKLFRVKIREEGDYHERKEYDHHEKGDLLDTCVICFDELFEGREVKMMPCSHMFHGDCIAQWLGQSNKCPLCRFEIYQF